MPSQPSPQLPDETISAWLRARRGHFDELVAGVEDYAIFMMSREGIILDWNRGAERLKGYTADEVIGRHFTLFYSDEDRASKFPDEELRIASAEGSFSIEGWRYRKDGSRFWASVTITAIRSEGGEVEGFLKITRDLTERKAAEEKLRRSEEHFRLLLENVVDYAIFMLDPEGHVMTWNSGARRIKQYEEEEIVGRHFSIFYPPEAITIGLPGALLGKALKEGRAEDEGWRVRKDGTRFWGNVVITALYDGSGELHGFTKITRDMSDRRQVEQLRETGRRKDAFLATLAHELRNPLAPMLPGVELILNAPGDIAAVSGVGEMLKRQVDQMARLIDDLLDMSRITAGKINLRRAVLPLRQVVDMAVEAVTPLVEERQHRLTLGLPDEAVMIEADPSRISQIISNLLSNAAKYTPPGGVIELSASCLSESVLEIKVRDNGIGIPKALQQSVFELFDQGASGSSEGLGIGLTLVRNLAEMHGGNVSVASEGEGKGCEFTVRLPVLAGSDATIASALVLEPSVLRKPGPARVLVADDGRSAADILAMFFQMEGMETVVAYDGAQAVEAASKFAPDFAFLDLGMPKLDGYEAARRIRRMYPRVFLAALSGWGAADDRRRSAEAGFDVHLLKPAKPDDLREVLRGHEAPSLSS
ncbi:PAS domain S-box protein [Haloferula sp. BvORR071]|uniref:PAS domain-containing hybrid sensor histidine kinase/response regulator n=1 Tax=Haloferula sp. BvORR071 TaxID=1396141 RepID=UPI000697B8FF|nr:PAS domain S-box protein [Haloferula sp. BvORR071]